ncbi:DUF1850 domain-containing protein [Sporolactobacillus sp. Y61]|uniref:DUF1850 domain-containing protein n=1 Tax=Sporolactobacillus sp. Y61 TaxID=3160863 RepID=A0AAU8IIT9_9BACL
MTRRISYISIVIVMTGSVLMFLFYPNRPALIFEDPETHRLLASLPVDEKDHFQIVFTHSVHLSDVCEEYVLKEGKIYPFQLTYSDTAVGMPANAGDGESFSVKNGKYRIQNLKGAYHGLNLTIGAIVANHRMIYQGKTYSLKNNFGPGKNILITYKKISYWSLWRGGKLT